ncbi:uncharacterized protein B0T15DRAFT_558763 [Chaetomium strumarium]|uniref:Uncharacterized protein n=1 Tax=Chaetomium strumarium TaxID=1170767 RepID=A0AAJ0M0S7_9PEZI|nr:hypothetical protein B0T15DRAFT_558763 [Chaetomium strumarium]
MPSSIKVFAALLGTTALARPNPTPPLPSNPVRILPYNWKYEIIALQGPGCPDAGPNSPEDYYHTRPTFGSNTVDGSEIYYWHFAYPHMRLAVEASSSSSSSSSSSIWCETTLRYTELTKTGAAPPAVPEYRLRLHKNGTAMIAAYELDAGVEAKWTFTYYHPTTDRDDGETEKLKKEPIVDTITVAGPRAAGTYTDVSVEGGLVQYPLPECGEGIIKYRTELTVKATKSGARGVVASEAYEREGKGKEYYGVQQGVSYDWEKCAA